MRFFQGRIRQHGQASISGSWRVEDIFEIHGSIRVGLGSQRRDANDIVTIGRRFPTTTTTQVIVLTVLVVLGQTGHIGEEKGRTNRWCAWCARHISWRVQHGRQSSTWREQVIGIGRMQPRKYVGTIECRRVWLAIVKSEICGRGCIQFSFTLSRSVVLLFFIVSVSTRSQWCHERIGSRTVETLGMVVVVVEFWQGSKCERTRRR